MKNLLFGFLAILATACTDTEITGRSSTSATDCFSFEVRGCETDQYASAIKNKTGEARSSAMKEWLKNNGIPVINVKQDSLVEKHLCEACHFCPSGEVFIIQTDTNIDTSMIAELQLLHFKGVACDQFN